MAKHTSWMDGPLAGAVGASALPGAALGSVALDPGAAVGVVASEDSMG
jgi:hypothetical protein